MVAPNSKERQHVRLHECSHLSTFGQRHQGAKMHQFRITASLIALVALAACAPKEEAGEPMAAAPAMEEPQWTTLSGSLDAWNPLGEANWRIEEDAFVADSGQGFLVSKESYGDFELELEFWTDGPANSGVFVRIENPLEVTDTTSYEINIFDTRPDQTYATGGLVNFAAPSQKMVAADKWNTYRITVQGDHIVIVMNDITTVDTQADAHMAPGPIALQAYAGTVKFRNVRIRTL
jgi:hypothetical protein